MLKVSETFKPKHLEYWPGEMPWWVRAGCGKHEDWGSNPQNVLKNECKMFDNWNVSPIPAVQVTDTSLTKLAGEVSVARKS